MQLRVTRSTLGNNSILTLHDGEGNPFAPAAGAFLSGLPGGFIGHATRGHVSP